MPLRMIDFRCEECGHEFEEIATVTDGKVKPEECPKCHGPAPMIEDFDKKVHRPGNRYRDVSWSTWSIS